MKRDFQDPQAELRCLFVRAVKADRRERERLAAAGVPDWRMAEAMRSNPHRIDFARFAELRCGAKGKRTGRPCPMRDLYGNGRCKWHGGLSTGPKTREGKARSASNGRVAVGFQSRPK